jgi:undecaprenyl-diphosphatase
MDIFQAIVLGIVQGLTEFLPISSSAHLFFVPWLFGWRYEGLAFDMALHMGTLLAVLAYFARDWVRIIGAWLGSVRDRRIGDDPDRRLSWLIILATIPAAVVGAVLEGPIEETFHNPDNPTPGLVAIGIMMIVMAALLLVAERVGRRALDLSHLNLRSAMTIGAAQAVALIPGVSRSGSTITAGLFLGMKREAAARFSFLLATPITLGAALKKVYDVLRAGGIAPEDQLGFGLGFLTSAVVGFLSIHFLLRYLQRRSTAPFIVYRFLVGTGLLALVLAGLS